MGCKQVSSKKKPDPENKNIIAALSADKNIEDNLQSKNIHFKENNEIFSYKENKDTSKSTPNQNLILRTIPEIIFEEENKVLLEKIKSKHQSHKNNHSISTILNKSKPESSKIDTQLDNSLNIQKTEPSPSQINIKIKYKQIQIFEKSYLETTFIEDLISDIQLKIPEFSTIKNYNYICHNQGHNILLEVNSKLTLIENLNKIPHHPHNQYKRNKVQNKNNLETPNEIIIEVFIEGLEDLPLSAFNYHCKNNLLAKPLSNPFEIAIYEIHTGNLRIERISNLILEHQAKELINFSDFSSYCNGSIDKLYISGGEKLLEDEKSSHQLFSSLYEINLNDLSNITHRNLINPRKLHSMIFIPNSYVFIVGGQTQVKGKVNTIKSVEVYDLYRKDIIIHSEMNEERIEPALCFIDDCYLYAFSGFPYKKYFNSCSSNNLNSLDNNFSCSFERINLRSNSKTWELLNPKLGSGIKFFSQNYFSVSYYIENKVIFLGGSHVNQIYPNCQKDQKDFSFCYDYKNNLIELSSFPHYTYEFSEKCFYPTNNKYLLIPIFDRESIEILKFSPQVGIRSIEFESEEKIEKMIEELNHENFINQVVLSEYVNHNVQYDALISMEDLSSYRFDSYRDRDRINITDELNKSRNDKKHKSFKFNSIELESIKEENKTEIVLLEENKQTEQEVQITEKSSGEDHKISKKEFSIQNYQNENNQNNENILIVENIEEAVQGENEKPENKIVTLVTFKAEEKLQIAPIEMRETELKDLDICPVENEIKEEAKENSVSLLKSSFYSLYLSEDTLILNHSQKNIPIDIIMTCPKSEKSSRINTSEKIHLQNSTETPEVKPKFTVEIPYLENEPIIVIDSLIHQNDNFHLEYQNVVLEVEKATDTIE
jgi:hypothetical protein